MRWSLNVVDLCGVHTFRGAAVGEDVEGRIFINFRLGDKLYQAKALEGDERNSGLDKLVSTDEFNNPAFHYEPIAPITVAGIHVTRHEGSSVDDDEVIQFRNIGDDAILLEVGTENAGDYYPSFVATYHKERLPKECMMSWLSKFDWVRMEDAMPVIEVDAGSDKRSVPCLILMNNMRMVAVWLACGQWMSHDTRFLSCAPGERNVSHWMYLPDRLG